MFEITIKSSVNEVLSLMDPICKQTLTSINYPDQNRVSFVIHELLINGIEATKRNFGDQVQKELSLYLSINNGELYVEVIDQAGGIPDSIKANISKNELDDVLMDDCGRGLLLLKSLVDQFWFEQDEQGNHKVCFIMRGANHGENDDTSETRE